MCCICGSKNVSQLTKVVIVMQLPGAAVDVAAYGCNDCANSKVVDRARPEDLYEIDVIRLVHFAKKIELKIGKEDKIVMKRPFDI